MAKKKQPKFKLNDWLEVDEKLKRMAEIKTDLESIEGKMTVEVHKVKEKYQDSSDKLQKEYKEIASSIEFFSRDHKEEFNSPRTKRLSFGEIGFRKSKKINIKSNEITVRLLKEEGFKTYILTEEKPDKEMMERLTDDELKKVGATRKIKDGIFIEPNMERVKKVGV